MIEKVNHDDTMTYKIEYTISFGYRDDDNYPVEDVEYYTIYTKSKNNITKQILDDLKNNDLYDCIIDTAVNDKNSYDGCYNLEIKSVSYYSPITHYMEFDKDPVFLNIIDELKEKEKIQLEKIRKSREKQEKERDRLKYQELKNKYGWE